MFQYTCPVEEFRGEIAVELRRIRRVVDSAGLTQECVLFQSETEPINVKDLKRYEVRQGTRTTGMSAKKEEDDDDETQEENPQECESKQDKYEDCSASQTSQKLSAFPPVPPLYHNQNARSHDEDPCANSGYRVRNNDRETV